MRFLFCSLSNPGLLYPAIGIAKALARSGHDVAFVTGKDQEQFLASLQLQNLFLEQKGSNCFQPATWFLPLSIAIQVKRIETALETFAPDVIVGQPLVWARQSLQREPVGAWRCSASRAIFGRPGPSS